MENATITQGHKTQSNFHSFLSNVSVSHVNDFEHVESVLSSLIEDSPDDSQDIMPLSHELRQAITNMEDIEDVCFKFNLLSHLKNILLTSTHFFMFAFYEIRICTDFTFSIKCCVLYLFAKLLKLEYMR